jgi:hypothetical protein
MFNTFVAEIRAVYEIFRENIVQPSRPQMRIWLIVRWIPKATNTHSEYVILPTLSL